MQFNKSFQQFLVIWSRKVGQFCVLKSIQGYLWAVSIYVLSDKPPEY